MKLYTYQGTYAIADDGKMPYPTFTVVHRATHENVSHHETAQDARQAAQRYHEADKRRALRTDPQGPQKALNLPSTPSD